MRREEDEEVIEEMESRDRLAAGRKDIRKKRKADDENNIKTVAAANPSFESYLSVSDNEERKMPARKKQRKSKSSSNVDDDQDDRKMPARKTNQVIIIPRSTKKALTADNGDDSDPEYGLNSMLGESWKLRSDFGIKPKGKTLVGILPIDKMILDAEEIVDARTIPSAQVDKEPFL
jgi:hypothetical protein